MLNNLVEWSYSPRQLGRVLGHAKRIRNNLDRVTLIGSVATARAVELRTTVVDRSREQELELLALDEIALAAQEHTAGNYNASRCALRRLTGLLDRWEESGELPDDVADCVTVEEGGGRQAATKRPAAADSSASGPFNLVSLIQRHRGALGWFVRARVLSRWSDDDRDDAAAFVEDFALDVINTLRAMGDGDAQKLAQTVGDTTRSLLQAAVAQSMDFPELFELLRVLEPLFSQVDDLQQGWA